MRRKFDVNVVVLLNGIGLFIPVRDMQVICLDTTSSGSVTVFPHFVVEYVEIVTVSESMMHSRSAWLAGSRALSRLSDNGICCPGQTFSGWFSVGTIRGVEFIETPEKTFLTRDPSFSLFGFQTWPWSTEDLTCALRGTSANVLGWYRSICLHLLVSVEPLRMSLAWTKYDICAAPPGPLVFSWKDGGSGCGSRR